jgi:hypothetical protein
VTAPLIRRLQHPRRFAWLLWLALMLPLAQSVAAWHAQSHWDTERARQSSGKQLLPGEGCEVCVAAAALSSGGLASTPVESAQPPLPHAAPLRSATGHAPTRPVASYDSRAPPLISL